MQSQQAQQDAFEASPLAFIACSRCRRDFLASPDPADWFYLTVCAHTVCARCTFPNGPPTGDLSTLQVACPACRTAGPLARLATDPSSELDHCFRPLGILLAELGMAAKWQVYNLTEQLSFFKAKCHEQKKTLGKLSGEIKKIKSLKAQNDQLSAENASLRQHLSALASPAQQSTGTSYDRAQGQYAEVSEQENYPSSDAGPRGQKRKFRSSPDRASLPLRPATHTTFRSSGSADLAQLHLPRQPSRLSLTPQHAKTHEQARQRHQYAHAVVDGQGAFQDQGRLAKLKLQGLLYFLKFDRLPRSSRNSFSHSSHEEQEQEHRQSANPVFYNPPPLLHPPHQQQDDPDTALMPPPPLPASRSRNPYSSQQQQQQPQHQHQQQQPRFSSTPIPSFSRASSAFTPSQLHAQHHQAPPTPSSNEQQQQSLPTASFASSSSSSHRQPFRPAGATPFGSGGSQQFARGR
ncbi:hypothetical protein JCM1840_004703 [Sporobolomyces johnsonii]